MKRVDYICVYVCAIAAALCYIGSSWASPVFCVSSLIGLADSIKKRVLSAALINGIFLTLNLAMTIKTIRGL